MAGDVLNDHDGVIDNEPGTNGEGHEGKVIQAVVAEVHHAESANQGEGHGNAGNDSGPIIPQEGKNHQDDEHDGDDQGDFDVMYGGTNGGGAVDSNAQMQG